MSKIIVDERFDCDVSTPTEEEFMQVHNDTDDKYMSFSIEGSSGYVCLNKTSALALQKLLEKFTSGTLGVSK